MTYRDEPDERPRCPVCHQLGQPTDDSERQKLRLTRYCPCTPAGTYFGAQSPDPKENQT